MMDHQSAALSSVDVLIEAVGRGSQVALQRLYEIESRRLYGIALRIVRRREIAAEVLQETFLQIWQNAAAFSHERGAGAAWLTGIVRFRALRSSQSRPGGPVGRSQARRRGSRTGCDRQDWGLGGSRCVASLFQIARA